MIKTLGNCCFSWGDHPGRQWQSTENRSPWDFLTERVYFHHGSSIYIWYMHFKIMFIIHPRKSITIQNVSIDVMYLYIYICVCYNIMFISWCLPWFCQDLFQTNSSSWFSKRFPMVFGKHHGVYPKGFPPSQCFSQRPRSGQSMTASPWTASRWTARRLVKTAGPQKSRDAGEAPGVLQMHLRTDIYNHIYRYRYDIYDISYIYMIYMIYIYIYIYHIYMIYIYILSKGTRR